MKQLKIAITALVAGDQLQAKKLMKEYIAAKSATILAEMQASEPGYSDERVPRRVVAIDVPFNTEDGSQIFGDHLYEYPAAHLIEANKGAGEVQINYGDVAKHFDQFVRQLRSKYNIIGSDARTYAREFVQLVDAHHTGDDEYETLTMGTLEHDEGLIFYILLDTN